MEQKPWMRIVPQTQVAASCSTDHSRYAIAAVLPVPGKIPKKVSPDDGLIPTDGWLVATNGRVLAIAAGGVHVEPGKPNPKRIALVPREALPLNARRVNLNGHIETIRGQGRTQKTELHPAVPDEVMFPPVADIVEGIKLDKMTWFGINAALLLDLAKSVCAAGGETKQIVVGLSDPKKPLVVMDGDTRQSFGLIMPCNADGDQGAQFDGLRQRFLRDLKRYEALKLGKEPPVEAIEIEAEEEPEVDPDQIGLSPTPDPQPGDLAPRKRREAMTDEVKQYRRLKERHPTTVVLLRVGDFYETFDEDARKIATAADLTLSQRGGLDCAGVPHHQLETYLRRFIEAGLQVAVAEKSQGGRTQTRDGAVDAQVAEDRELVAAAQLRIHDMSVDETALFVSALGRVKPGREGQPLCKADRDALRAIVERAAVAA